MYEHYIATTKNGITSIDIDLDLNNLDSRSGRTETTDGLSITTTFAVTTDSKAWMTVDGHGRVHPAFGGTGVTQSELDTYAEQAVSIWRAITGNDATTCRYAGATSDSTNESSTGTDSCDIINA